MTVCVAGNTDYPVRASPEITILDTRASPQLLVQIAMLESSDVLYIIGGTTNSIECLRRYAMVQRIPIAYNWTQVLAAIDNYPDSYQMSFFEENV